MVGEIEVHSTPPRPGWYITNYPTEDPADKTYTGPFNSRDAVVEYVADIGTDPLVATERIEEVT